jgi:hypothetical protein
MNHLFRLIVLTLGGLISNIVIADTLANEAQARGINPTCLKYLEQIEKTNKLSGLNLTTTFSSNSPLTPSLHTKASKLEDGVSFFSTTLSPDGEFCNISIIATTHSNVNNCKEIAQTRLINDPSLKETNYADGGYTLLNRENDNYTVILIDTGDSSCLLTETQMMWPGR